MAYHHVIAATDLLDQNLFLVLKMKQLMLLTMLRTTSDLGTRGRNVVDVHFLLAVNLSCYQSLWHENPKFNWIKSLIGGHQFSGHKPGLVLRKGGYNRRLTGKKF